MKSILTLFAALFCFVLISGASAQSIGVIPPCTPAPVGLVSWWAAENNALDLRSRFDGTLNGNATYAAGRVGQAFSLDGSGDRVLIGNPANLQLQNFTIEGWIKRTSSTLVTNDPFPGSVNGTIFAYGQDGYGLVLRDTNKLALTKVGVSQVTTPTLTITDTNYHHIAVTKSGSQVIFYVDGVADTPVALGDTFTFNSAAIGARGDGNLQNAFFGDVDELEIYNRALSASELLAIYNANTAGKCKPTATVAPANLVGWWSGDGNANDIAGTNNGTLQNGAGFVVGKVGQGFVLDGVDDVVQLNNTLYNPFPATGFTYEFWINPTDTPPGRSRTIITNHQSGGNFWNGISVSSATINLTLQNSSTGLSFNWLTTSTLSPNTLYHIAVTYQNQGTLATDATIYINGIPQTLSISGGGYSSGFVPGHNPGDPLGLTIGRLNEDIPNAFFKGLIDELSLYSRVLSPSEVQSIYNAGLAGKLKTVTTPIDAPEFARNKTFTAVSPQVVNVTVGDATVTFPTVTTAGITQEIPISLTGLPVIPLSGSSTGLNYDIATSAVYTGSPTVCFNLPSLTSQFGFLRILHLENGVWVNRTNTASISPNLCSTALPSLSPFAIVAGLSPTAATVSVLGRIFAGKDRGLANARVTFTDSEGNLRTAISNAFGYYRFDDVAVGQTYVFSVTSKRYQFAPQVVFVTEDVGDLDFTAQ